MESVLFQFLNFPDLKMSEYTIPIFVSSVTPETEILRTAYLYWEKQDLQHNGCKNTKGPGKMVASLVLTK